MSSRWSEKVQALDVHESENVQALEVHEALDVHESEAWHVPSILAPVLAELCSRSLRMLRASRTASTYPSEDLDSDNFRRFYGATRSRQYSLKKIGIFPDQFFQAVQVLSRV